MSRKKVNPNRIPISEKDYDLDEIKRQATGGMVLQTWAVILAAMSNLEGMTAGKLVDFWLRMDQAPTKIQTFDDTERELAKIRKLSGVTLSVQRVSLEIHTRGDLTRFVRTVTANAVAAAFAVIAEPMIREEALPPEDLWSVLRRAAAANEEIADGEISVQDIQQMLLEEFGLQLTDVGNQCVLTVAGTKSQS